MLDFSKQHSAAVHWMDTLPPDIQRLFRTSGPPWAWIVRWCSRLLGGPTARSAKRQMTEAKPRTGFTANLPPKRFSSSLTATKLQRSSNFHSNPGCKMPYVGVEALLYSRSLVLSQASLREKPDEPAPEPNSFTSVGGVAGHWFVCGFVRGVYPRLFAPRKLFLRLSRFPIRRIRRRNRRSITLFWCPSMDSGTTTR